MRVLISGADGFVGRHFRSVLDTPDNEVVGFDIKSGHDALDWFGTNGDRSHYDLVLHCAAVVGGRTMIEGQPLAVAVDLAIDALLFQWAMRNRPGRIVYFSSSAAYPTRLQGPVHHRRLVETDIDLDDIEQADAVYGHVKLTGEMLAAHARAEGLDVTVVRPFSGYGPDQDLTYPFPSFIRRATTGAAPFQVWGDGRQVRDWIHIDDVVGSVLALVAAGVDGPVNLCTGRATSMDDLAAMTMAAAGHRAPLEHLVGAPAGVQWRVGDPAGMLRWYEPRWSLESGVADAVDRARLAA